MALPTAEQVTNMYLYGTVTRPNDLLDPTILKHRTASSKNMINVDIVEYMNDGPGRFVNGANFEVVTQFFRSSLIPTGAYTKNQIFHLLGINYGGYSINQLYLGTNDTDYAERTYI